MKYLHLLFIIGITLSGCATRETHESNGVIYKNLKYKYQIEIPQLIYKNGMDPESYSVVFGSTAAVRPIQGDEYNVSIHAIPCDDNSDQCFKKIPVEAASYYRGSCKESVKNAVTIENNEHVYTVTGEFPGYPCSTHACDTSKYYMARFTNRYLLCSEHEGKTVLVEVNQMQGDRKKAQEIFSTFRWLE